MRNVVFIWRYLMLSICLPFLGNSQTTIFPSQELSVQFYQNNPVLKFAPGEGLGIGYMPFSSPLRDYEKTAFQFEVGTAWPVQSAFLYIYPDVTHFTAPVTISVVSDDWTYNTPMTAFPALLPAASPSQLSALFACLDCNNPALDNFAYRIDVSQLMTAANIALGTAGSISLVISSTQPGITLSSAKYILTNYPEYSNLAPKLEVTYDTAANTPPVVTGVEVTGTLKAGSTLTGRYIYNDADNDPENGSTYRWFRSESSSGSGRVAIPGATDTVYVTTAADEGKYFSFEVTPHDGTVAGNAVESARSGRLLSAGNNVLHFGPGAAVTGLSGVSSGPFTLEFRILPDHSGNRWQGIYWLENRGTEPGIYMEQNETISIRDNKGDVYNSAEPLQLRVWNHVAFVYDGLWLSVYINGQQTASWPYMIGNELLPAGQWRMGAGNGLGGDYNLSGSAMDEFRIWSHARSAAQVQAGMNNLLTLPQSGLTRYYDFDHGIGGADNQGITWLRDRIGFVTGTLSGFTLNGMTSNWMPKDKDSVAAVLPDVVTVGAAVHPSMSFYASLTGGVTGNGITEAGFVWAFSPAPDTQDHKLIYGMTVADSFTMDAALPAGKEIYVRAYAVNAAGIAYGNEIRFVVQHGVPPGNALHFDGIDDFVEIAHEPSTAFSGEDDFTVECWVKPEQSTGENVVLLKSGYYDEMQYRLSVRPDSTILFGMERMVTGGWGWYNTLMKIPSSQWSHIAVTRKDTSVQIFIDGVARPAFMMGTTSYRNAGKATGMMWLGADNSNLFKGSLDEMRIWNQARTAQEVLSSYKDTVSPISSGLVAYYRFNQGRSGEANSQIDSLYNEVSSGKNGHLLNFALSGNGSNWQQSLAMVAPVAEEAVNMTQTGFTAGWSAPAVTVDKYLLDVAGDSLFAGFITGYRSRDVGNSLSAVISGIARTEGQTYYYRVRAQRGDDITTWSDVIKVSNRYLPAAEAVFTDGVPFAGQDITAIYRYPDSLIAGGVGLKYNWYRADDSAGTNRVRIEGSDSLTYTLTAADEGKYISFGVYPYQGHDTGVQRISRGLGPVLPGLLARAQDLTLYLNAAGTAVLLPEDADNGSAGYASLSLDTTTFNCTATGSRDTDHALRFTAQANRVQLPAALSSEMNTTGRFSFSGWFRWDDSSFSGDRRMITIGSNWNDWCLYLDAGDSGRPSFTVSGNYVNRVIAVTAITDGLWHHVAGTYDGSVARIYVDGRLEGANFQSRKNISYSSGNIGNGFTGLIDEVALHSRAVTAGEIRSLMNGHHLRDGTIAHYKFNEGSGSVVSNMQGSNHGTLTGGLSANSAWSSGGKSLTSGGSGALTAIHSLGHSTTDYFIRTVADTAKPFAYARNMRLYLDPAGNGRIAVSDIDGSSSDNCGIDTMWIDREIFTTSNEGVNQVTLTMRDKAGNTASAVAEVIVIPFLSAGIRSYNVYLDSNGAWTVSASDMDSSSTGFAGLSLSRTQFDCTDLAGEGAWEMLGGAAAVDGEVYDAMLATGRDGAVYLAFQDRTHTINSIRVLKWNDTGWIQIGNEIPWISYPRALTVGPDGNPFLAYEQPGDFDGIRVVRWDGSQWSPLGDRVMERDNSWGYDMKFSPDGTLYFAYHDMVSYFSMSTRVTRWTGSSWQELGSGIPVNNAGGQSLAFGGGDTVYVAFDEFSMSGQAGASVYFWNGSAWAALGSRRMSQGQAGYTKLVTDPQGVPHIAYSDIIQNERVVVRRWNGSSWQFLGSDRGVSSGNVMYLDMDFGPDGNLNLLYSDYNTGVSHVLRWNGAAWDPLGTTGSGAAYGQRLSVAGDGKLYIAQQRVQDDAPFVLFWSEGISVVLSAYNNYGDTVRAATQIQVADTLAPVIRTRDLTVYLDTAGVAEISVALVDNASSDNCGIDSIWLDRTGFTCTDTGLFMVTLYARDSSGNVGLGTSAVMVRDTLEPVVFAIQSRLYLDTSGYASLVVSQLDSGSYDNCGIDSMWLDRSGFNCTDTGLHTVTLYVRDSSGNIGSATSQVTVADTMPPFVYTRSSLTVWLDTSGSASLTVDQVDSASFDNCGIDSMWLDRTDFNCADAGLHTVMLYVRDSSGNISAATSEVTVSDTLSPAVYAHSNLTVWLDVSGTASLTVDQIDSASFDNCGIDSMWLDRADFTCVDAGQHSVTFYVRDSSGNIATATSVITVSDTLSPAVYAHSNLTVWLDASGTVSLTVDQIDSASSDNCGIDSMWLDRADFTCVDAGLHSVTLYVRDSSGNTGTATSVITVSDTLSPVVYARGTVTVWLDASGTASLTAVQVDSASSDNCGIDSIWLDKASFSCADTGLHMVALYVRDSSGNIGSTTSIIRVADTSLPVVYAYRSLAVWLDASGSASVTVDQLDSASYDNCGIDSMWLDRSGFGCPDAGLHIVTLYVRDSSGNIGTATSAITVFDTMLPVVYTHSSFTVWLDASGSASVTVAQLDSASYDNCGIDSMWLDKSGFSCGDTGLHSITLYIRDSSGNTGTATSVITVSDTLSPVVYTHDSLTVWLDASGSASITAAQADSGSYDNCGVDSMWLDRTSFGCSDKGVRTVTLYVQDNNGNIASGTIIITVADTFLPVVNTQNVSVYLDHSGSVSVATADIDNGSWDNCGIDSMWLSRTAFSCADTGARIVTLTARDFNGNINSASAVVTVFDTIRPVALARSLTLYLDSAGMAAITPDDADNGSYDNCGVVLSMSRTVYTCVETGLNREILTVTDPSGNASTAQVLVTVLDTIRPQVRTRNLVLELNAQGKATLIASQLDSGSTDNCTNLLHFSADRTEFTCSDTGVHTVLLTVTDNKNNSTTGQALVTVRDLTPPVVHARNVTVYLDASGKAVVSAADVDNGSTDNCGIADLYLDRDTFSCADRGQNTVRLYAADLSGNVAWSNAVITVADTATPDVYARDITLYLDASGMVDLTASMVDDGSTDNCGIAVMSLDKSSFNCTNLGVNTVRLTATDASGRSASKSASVTVLDTIRPVVRVKHISVSLNAAGSAVISAADINDGSFDNCGIQSLALSRTAFGCADTGLHQITLTVTDIAGNTQSAEALVQVQDEIPPVVIPRYISVYLNAAGMVSISAADVDNGSTDNCGRASRTLDRNSFGCADLGQNIILLTVRDSSGNSSMAQAVVTVLDTIRPVVAVRDVTVYLNAAGMASVSVADVDSGSSDNCGVMARVLDRTSFICSDAGQHVVTLTVTDASGNSSSRTATVTVADTIRPVILARNQTLYLSASGTAVLTVANVNSGSTDNCGIAQMSLSKNLFGCADAGDNVVVFTARDIHGNINEEQIVVTVIDQTAPIVRTNNLSVYLDANGTASVTKEQVNNNSTDNCGIHTMELDIDVFDCADLGGNTITLTATDDNGNSMQRTAVVTVYDTIRPVISNLPGVITAYVGSGQCSAPVQWPSITAVDNCTGTQVHTSHLNGGVFPVGTTVVTVTARDGSGNMQRADFTVTVADTTAPVFSNIPVVFTVQPDSTGCGALVSWSEPFAADNCGTPVVTRTHAPGSIFPVGNTVVTYTAADRYNNISTVSFNVVVRDEVAPVINWNGGGGNLVVSAEPGRCDAAVSFVPPVASDNCGGVSISGTHSSGDRFQVGTTTVLFTAVDAAGNRTSGSFTVTVEDREAPEVISAPVDDTVGICQATYMYAMPGGRDNCGPVKVTRTAGLASGNVFPVGTTLNTFELEDAAGNITTVSFRVTVLPQGDVQLPSLTSVCVYEQPVDLVSGQSGLVWEGAGVISGSLFDPAVAGAGRHTLRYSYMDAQSCRTAGSVAVTVFPRPAKPEVTRIGATTLATGNYIAYQWYRDGRLIPGATKQQYTYAGGGNYQVVVSNTDGCNAVSDDYVIGIRGGGVGVEELLVYTDLLLYPNPTTGLVTVEVPVHWREKLHIEGYSASGQRILSREVLHRNVEPVEIDLSDLPRGVYYLNFISGGYNTSRKVVLR